MNTLMRVGLAIAAFGIVACQAPSNTSSTSATESPSSSATDSPSSVTPSDTVATTAGTVTRAGQFQSGEHPTSGQAQLIEQAGQTYIAFADDFQTDNGPDLVVVLHRSADVISSTQPPAYSLNEADYIVLAPLQSTSGAQQYLIPQGTNLADYRSVAVWCRQFNATFGAANLTNAG